MSIPGRPKLAEFEGRLGREFRVCAEDGSEAVTWRLEKCEELEKPPLEVLADEDCYLLIFSCEASGPQGHYEVRTEDGFSMKVFAVPAAADRMCVTVN